MINFWVRSPLYLRIIGAVIFGLIFGLILGKEAALLSIPAKLILRLLTTIAPPLILLAIIQALVRANLRKGQATRLAKALILNTIVAISIGLFVANFIKPGSWSHFAKGSQEQIISIIQGPITQFLDNIPKSIAGPFSDDGKVMGVIFLAVALGVAALFGKAAVLAQANLAGGGNAETGRATSPLPPARHSEVGDAAEAHAEVRQRRHLELDLRVVRERLVVERFLPAHPRHGTRAAGTREQKDFVFSGQPVSSIRPWPNPRGSPACRTPA